MANALHWHVRSCPCSHHKRASRGRHKQHTMALLGNSKDGHCKNQDSSSSSSSSSPRRGSDEEPPVVIPEVFPPPARGSQYQSRDEAFTLGSGSGGGAGRGGVFNAFSSGDMWKGGGAGSSLLVRIRLMLFSFAWACCVYLIISNSAKLLVRLDRWLGITAGLGYGYRARAQAQAAADADEDDASSTEDLIEVAGMVNQGAATTAPSGSKTAAAVGGSSQVDVGAGSRILPKGTAAGDTGQSAAQATEAAPLDPSMQAHLQALKRYEQHGTRGVDIGTHATAAYFMIMSTLAFFFVVNQ